MKHFFLTTFIIFITSSLKSQTLDTLKWEQNAFDANHKVVNLGGTIENFPEEPIVNKGVKSKRRKKTVNELWEEVLKKEEQKPQNSEPVRSYTFDELDKMGMITHGDQKESKSLYAYVLIFFLLCFFIFYFRASVKKGLIIFLSRFFYTNSKSKHIKESRRSNALEIKEKLTALKDLENLHSTGVINEAEFNRLKTQILN
jgi:hypothetical protein